MLYPSGPIIIPRQSCRPPTWGGSLCSSTTSTHSAKQNNQQYSRSQHLLILQSTTVFETCNNYLALPLVTTAYHHLLLGNNHHSHINITTMVTNALLIGTITSLKHTRSSFSRVSSPSLQTKYFRSSHTIFKLHLSARFALQVVNFVQRQILHNQVHRRINIRCLWKSGIEKKSNVEATFSRLTATAIIEKIWRKK